MNARSCNFVFSGGRLPIFPGEGSLFFRVGGLGAALLIRRAVKVSQLRRRVGSLCMQSHLLHIHCTTSCTLPVKLLLKPHLKKGN